MQKRHNYYILTKLYRDIFLFIVHKIRNVLCQLLGYFILTLSFYNNNFMAYIFVEKCSKYSILFYSVIKHFSFFLMLFLDLPKFVTATILNILRVLFETASPLCRLVYNMSLITLSHKTYDLFRLYHGNKLRHISQMAFSVLMTSINVRPSTAYSASSSELYLWKNIYLSLLDGQIIWNV